MQTRLKKHTMVMSFDVSLTISREGKLNGFSYLESLKKCKRRLHWGTFFEGSLVSSKKEVK
jgi:hypothetical protein